MDIKAYIESGILENYVLGILNETEENEVRTMSNRYPAIQEELEEIEGALAAYALLHAVELPSDLKTKVIEPIEHFSAEEDDLSFLWKK